MRARIHAAIKHKGDPIRHATVGAFAALQFRLLEMLKLVLHAGLSTKGRMAKLQKVAVSVKDQVIAAHEDSQKDRQKQRDCEEPPESIDKVAVKKRIQTKGNDAQQYRAQCNSTIQGTDLRTS